MLVSTYPVAVRRRCRHYLGSRVAYGGRQKVVRKVPGAIASRYLPLSALGPRASASNELI
jgi:hypothetical protein